MQTVLNFMKTSAVLLSVGGASQFGLADGLSDPAIYDLPPHESYEGFSSFEMDVTFWSVEDGSYSLVYELPEDLMGRSGDMMVMVGDKEENSDFLDLFCSATNTTARCTVSETSIACALKFGDLSIDPDAVEEFLQAKFEGDPDLDKRLAAARIFADDAIGTMLIQWPLKDEDGNER